MRLKTSSAVSDPTEDESGERDIAVQVQLLGAWLILLGGGEVAHEVRRTPLSTSVA